MPAGPVAGKTFFVLASCARKMAFTSATRLTNNHRAQQMKLKITLLLLVILIPLTSYGNQPCINLYPDCQTLYDENPWSIAYYYGITGDDTFGQMVGGQFHRWPEHVQSAELAYTLNKDNVVRRFFSPVVGVVQLAANVAIRQGSNEPTIYEFDPYIGFRWANFPWNKTVMTTFALGEGISYASHVPAIERSNSKETKQLLNYMLVEVTVAAPAYPRLQLMFRIHHRSGAFGLYGAGNSGSNVIGLGIKYLFE